MTNTDKNRILTVGALALVLGFLLKKGSSIGGIGDTNYQRVIPRDFFNESKLLKCMGRLSLLILDGKTPNGIDINIEESYEKFNVAQDGMQDIIYVSNYPVSINNELYVCGTTINSKDPYPFYVIKGYDQIEVFDDAGNFTSEFIEEFEN